jgi:ribosomal protein S18 acetylase RimI-like enzyme
MYNSADIQYLDIDTSWRDRISGQFGETAARHLRFSDGFSIAAIDQEQIAGFISVYWNKLPDPFTNTLEGYINIIEVDPHYRRRGIASKLVDLAMQRAVDQNACQLRAWSSEDKTEALAMWKKLGFGLSPAFQYFRGQEIRGFYVTKVLG